MPIHPITPPEDDAFQSPPEKPAAESDAVLEAWAEAVKADARASNLAKNYRALQQELEERSRQAVLMRHVANLLTATSGPGSLAHLILEVLGSELGARQGLVWVLGQDRYLAMHGMGFDRPQLNSLWLPLPHPFPNYPVLIYQWQWLEAESLPPGLRLIQAHPEDGLFFVPFEHQTLLVGFAVISLPKSRTLQPLEQETMEILQRLFAGALHGTWMLLDLQQQREYLREEARSLKVQAEALDQRNQALRQGQSLQVDFLSYAARALREQLGSILARMEEVRKGTDLDPDIQEGLLLDGLLAGRHMEELLRVLSDLATPDKSSVQVQPLGMAAFFADLNPLIEAFLRRRGGLLVLPDALDLPEVLVDEEILRQVILNLCAGALSTSLDGSLRLWIEPEPMTLALKLWVEGLDLGYTTELLNDRKSLFAEGQYLEGQGGMGLGLVMCHDLMIAMSCDLHLERDPSGSGTIIVMELPLA